ncbi:hypothetical protein BXO88_10050 [Oribacterium sp. C9]|nr:hypothetical protein BXO88_10050 [Oribacterium sp. C9]
MADAIIEHQSLGVDAISGATVSSSAVRMLVSDAVEQAGFFGDYYPGREALGVGAYMGFISGENAAKYAAK